jgi:pyrroline-5-carboxylate reductase
MKVMKIAILGAGRMGCALARGMVAAGSVPGECITLTSSSPEKASLAAEKLGVGYATTNPGALAEAEVAFLCVKPAKALPLLREISSHLSGKLVISVVAGLRSESLQEAAGPSVRLIRSMPNTAVRFRLGVTALAPSATATMDDLSTANRLFSSVGTAVVVGEDDLDTVTAVSGSGPAFALLMLEALMEGGHEGGLSVDRARIFAAGALSAAASLVSCSDETPLALRTEITSPGGTTEAGLSVLEDSDFTGSVRAAVRAARLRSAELSRTDRKA